MACEDPDLNEKIFRLAEQIKKDFYGNRIVLFAPLYLSNYCINGWYLLSISFEKQTYPTQEIIPEDIKREVIALQDMGHKRLALEASEDPVHNTMDYYFGSINTIYNIKHKNGAIRRVNINIAATTVDNYRLLKEAGSEPTSCSRKPHKESYLELHPTSSKNTTMIITPKPWTVLWKAA